MIEHCDHARVVYNTALAQYQARRSIPGRPPRHLDRCRELTEARSTLSWLRAGSQTVQQQALRDFDRALRNWWTGTQRHPRFREKGVREGFQIVGRHALEVEKLNRKWSRVRIPKVGWVKFRRTRSLRPWKSYRVKRTMDGKWHIAFASIPDPIPAPSNGEVVGIDRGVRVTMALSTGEMWEIPRPSMRQAERRLRLERELARRQKKSKRRERTRRELARHRRHHGSTRKDFVEKATTDVARRFDIIRIEDLRIEQMTKSNRGTVDRPGRSVRQKTAWNRSIRQSGWGLIDRRLHDKAPGRVEKINPRHTSQRCSLCGHTAPENRESQAVFRCKSCAHTANADVNAAMNIAAGRAVAGRGDISKVGDALPALAGALSTKRQPQLTPSG